MTFKGGGSWRQSLGGYGGLDMDLRERSGLQISLRKTAH